MQFPADWSGAKKLTLGSAMIDGSSDLAEYELLLNESILSAGEKTTIFGNSQGKQINDNSYLSDSFLEGYWRMESDGSDYSPNSYDLTELNTPTYTTGAFGNAASLAAASSQGFSIADASCPNLEPSANGGSFTWTCRFKVNSFPSNMSLMSKDSSGTNIKLLVLATGAIRATLAGVSGLTTDTDTGIIEASRWYQVLVSYDDKTKRRIVAVNGQTLLDEIGSGSPSDTNGVFWVGRDNGSSYFDGLIDDIAVFSRFFTPQEAYHFYVGGADIRFSIKTGGSYYLIPHTLFDWDIDNEKFSGVVKLPTAYYSADAEFYMHYNNSSAVPLGRELGSLASLIDDSNLQAYYKMESDGSDETANANDLTEVGSPSYGSGFFGNCLDLGSSNSTKYLYIDNDLGISGGAISLVAKVKINDDITSGSYTFICQSDSSTYTRNLIRYEYNSGSPRLVFSRIKNNVAGQGVNYTMTLDTDRWYRLGMAYDGSTVYAYVDGVLVGTATASGNGTTSGNDALSIGADRGSNSTPSVINFASAKLDDVGVFDRCLSIVDMAMLHGNTGGSFRDSCRAFYAFNGLGKDLTVYGNDYTDFNGNTWVAGSFGEAVNFERDNSEYWSVPASNQNDLAPSTTTDRTLLLLSKNQDIASGKNENMLGWLDTGNTTGLGIRVAQDIRSYGLEDLGSNSFWVSASNNTLRAGTDSAYDVSGSWVFWGGTYQATTSSGVGFLHYDGNTSSTDTHTVTPDDVSSLDFSIGRMGELTSNYGDFSADLAMVYHEYMDANRMSSMQKNIDNMSSYITVSDVSDISKISLIAQASIKKIAGITNANTKKVSGVAN